MEDQENYLIKVFQRRLLATPTTFYRYLYEQIDWGDTLIGIKGPKGCGKTTMLLQHIKETFRGHDLDKVLYVSLDNLWFTTHDIRDVVESHYTHGGTHIFIDEIHYYKHWKTLLKNLCDDYPDLHIVYTGSSMLQLESSERTYGHKMTIFLANLLYNIAFIAVWGIVYGLILLIGVIIGAIAGSDSSSVAVFGVLISIFTFILAVLLIAVYIVGRIGCQAVIYRKLCKEKK